ncbi:MAG: type II secretion system GspH family protein [Candidatus Doudnabacteria bacterium]|nr:type II secretion system GspH family protein [Candidatus Doudnabacteria bacterium]
MSKETKRQLGMTLIELVVSMAMIGSLVVLYSSLFNVIIVTKNMKRENLAYHIANQKMEELRATPYLSLPPSATFTNTNLSQLPQSSANFTVTNYSTYSGMKEFVVTVNWNDGTAKNVTIKSLAGTGGINP